jgi:nicotinate-nucleotide adenylyltransferase
VTHRVAIFGGSFNPPHVAHVLATTLVLTTSDVDSVLVVPTYRHPFAKPLAPFEDRVRMCALAMGWIPQVSISRVEEELGGESRTLHTLEHLKDAQPSWEMRLVLGSDAYAESAKWYRFDRIRALAPPIVLGRDRVSAGGARTLLPAISSTDVRASIARGDWQALTDIVPAKVIAYIRDKGLYLGRGQ